MFRSDEPSEWQRLDLRLLQNGPITLYHEPAILEEDLAWLASNHYVIDRIDCSSWSRSELAHTALAAAFVFPEYYGRSLDALADCTSDLEVPDRGGRVIVLDRFDVPAAMLGDFAYLLLDIIASTARDKLLFGRRLLALVQSDNPALGFPPVGASAVGWNPREWMNRARGL